MSSRLDFKVKPLIAELDFLSIPFDFVNVTQHKIHNRYDVLVMFEPYLIPDGLEFVTALM